MYKITTPPATEPLSLEEVKTHLKVEHTVDDTYIESIIAAVRQYVEIHLGRLLMTQTVLEAKDSFPMCKNRNPRGGFELRFAPVQGITEFKYKDTDGNDQVLSPTDFILDKISEPPRIYPKVGASWTSTQNVPNAVQITYTAGYTQASDVPPVIKQAMLLIIAKLYEGREDTVKKMPTHAEWLLKTIKIEHL